MKNSFIYIVPPDEDPVPDPKPVDKSFFKTAISNPNEELELLKKYGYCSFHLSTEQYLKKLSLSLSNIAGGFGSLKKGVIS